MQTLDQFFEIEFLTYSDICNKSSSTSVPRLERIMLYNRATEHSSQQGMFSLSSRKFMNINKASKTATHDLVQQKLQRFLTILSVTSELLSMLVS